jgi:RND family efflux transporter MFP subunit
LLLTKYYLICVSGLLFLITGCQSLPSSQEPPAVESQVSKAVNVDVAIARPGSLVNNIEYIGTTFPDRQVSLRSQIEGQILDLTVEVGDTVSEGQVLARIDDRLSSSVVIEARSELAALQSEVASLKAEIDDALAIVERAQIELQQAKSNAARRDTLFRQGAISEQEAELSRTAVATAQQSVKSAQEQVRNRQQAEIAAQNRVSAQQALVAQEEKRQSFTILTSPVNGSVLTKVLESGDLAQSGSEILSLGDFSRIKVRVRVSEKELAQIRLGQTAIVRLDAFPDRSIAGKVSQISPSADPTARLIPIEVTIPNIERRIGSGLLARISFSQPNTQRIVVPETAVQMTAETGIEDSNTGTIFSIDRSSQRVTVKAQPVRLGDRANDLVEIISGLEPATEFVVRSSDNLQQGDLVRPSFISETQFQR